MRGGYLTASLLAASLLLGGCDREPHWMLDAPAFYPTALDYWEQERTFLVGSYQTGSVVRVDASGRSAGDLLRNANSRRPKRAIRLRTDSARNRLWVLDEDSVYVYALPSAALVSRIELPRFVSSRAACLPDLALDAFGNGFVSDNERPALYRIDADSMALSMIPVRVSAEHTSHEGLSALAPTRWPGVMLAGSAASGRLWLIDLPTGSANPVEMAGDLKGICGLTRDAVPGDARAYRDPLLATNRYYATTGFENRLLRLELAYQWKNRASAVATQLAPHRDLDTPIGIRARDTVLLVASSQLQTRRDFNGGNSYPPLLPFRILLVAK